MAKVLRTFRLELEEWAAFLDLARSGGETASERLRRLILRDLGRSEGPISAPAEPRKPVFAATDLSQRPVRGLSKAQQAGKGRKSGS